MEENNKWVSWGTPLMFLIILFLSFGLMIPWLGHEFDEWHFVYYATRGAQGLTEIFYYDGHPQAVWSYIPSFNLLGYNPVAWHLYSLLWRWLAVLSFWLCLKRIWPYYRRQIFFASALFAIHPVFTLQIFPISFYEIWLGYVLLFLSFFFTILAAQDIKRSRVFTIISIALALGHAFTSEYTWFVELMRPVFIWLALPSDERLRKKIIHVAKTWMPTCAIFVSAVVWRGFFYTPLRKAFQVQGDLFADPARTILSWAMNFLPDASIVLVTSWYKTFSSEYMYLARPFNLGLILLLLLMLVVGSVYLRQVDRLSQNSEQWSTQAVFLGLPSLLFGILPFYIASYSIQWTEPPYNSRLALGMLPGAALISAAVIEKIVSKQNQKILMSLVILGAAIAWHIRYTNDYRKVWEYQSNFLQQLIWRAPGIERNTILFVWQPSLPNLGNSEANFAFYGDFSLSLAVNSLYEPDPIAAENRLSYWYSFLSGESAAVMDNSPLRLEHATTYFEGNSSDSLFFYYDPQNDRCLHLVAPEDRFYKQYPKTIKEIASQTTPDRILLETRQNTSLRDDIFNGGEKSWCYFYQKAELARQYQQWDEIKLLWNGAVGNNLQTAIGTEYIPFIDGFAHLSDWQSAAELTISANKHSKAMSSILCPLWNSIEQSTSDSGERDETIRQIKVELECANQ